MAAAYEQRLQALYSNKCNSRLSEVDRDAREQNHRVFVNDSLPVGVLFA